MDDFLEDDLELSHTLIPRLSTSPGPVIARSRGRFVLLGDTDTYHGLRRTYPRKGVGHSPSRRCVCTPDRELSPQNPVLKIIRHNWNLLIHNIDINDMFCADLKNRGVMNSTMISKIQSHEDATDRSGELLSILSQQDAFSFTRFCDSLQETGHVLLSDHLKREAVEANLTLGYGDGLDLFHQIPRLNGLLDQRHKRMLIAYIHDKVKESRILGRLDRVAKPVDRPSNHMLNTTQKLKEEHRQLEIKIQELQQRIQSDNHRSHEKKSELKVKDAELHTLKRIHKDEIEELQRLIQSKNQRIQEKDEEINAMAAEIQTLTRKHRDELQSAAASQTHSDASIQRINSHLDAFDKQIGDLNIRIRQFFGEHPERLAEDAENISVSLLQRNIGRLMGKVDQLQARNDHRDSEFRQERMQVLQILGLLEQHQPLHTAVQDVISQHAMHSTQLAKHLTTITNILQVARQPGPAGKPSNLKNTQTRPNDATAIKVPAMKWNDAEDNEIDGIAVSQRLKSLSEQLEQIIPEIQKLRPEKTVEKEKKSLDQTKPKRRIPRPKVTFKKT